MRLFLWLWGWIGFRNYRLAICIRRRTTGYNLISLASDRTASSFGYKLVPCNVSNTLCPRDITEVGVISQYAGIQELIPKRRRKRQPDAIALMDDRLLRTAAVPMLLMFLAFTAMDKVSGDLLRISVLFILNGIILYVPRLRPSGNKDSRMLTPFDGVIFGLASGFGILPGFSRMGAYMSVASLRGADRQHSLGMALILGIPALTAMLVIDLVWLILAGFAGFSLILVLKGILAAAAAYIGTWFGITFVRFLSVKKGYSVFAYYCWGAALFVFILYLMI